MVSELTVILGDFFLPARAPPAQALPRLDALELLLARAERVRLPGSWRAWLAAVGAPSALASLPPARLAARAWLAPPAGPESFWFATPVHYLAGIDSVHLHPAGLLALAPEEQATLAADFNALFGDAHWRLHALGQRELLLAGPPLAASAADPGQWAGRDPSGAAPRGADANALRRLGSEIEMWLHQHPLNAQRRARGELAVTGLWLWGSEPPAGAEPARVAAPRELPVLYGADLYALGLWRLAGHAARALPAAFDTVRAQHDARSVVLYPALGAEGLTQLLQRLEQHWLAPALAALQAQRLGALRLLAGERAYRLSRLRLARFWRARAPWWQALA
jgi:hypothetical protein